MGLLLRMNLANIISNGFIFIQPEILYNRVFLRFFPAQPFLYTIILSFEISNLNVGFKSWLQIEAMKFSTKL